MYGIVKQVNEFELIVSLTDHHTAFVSCNRVSKYLENLFKAFTGTADDASTLKGAEETAISAPPTMREYYRVGQSVVGTVIAVAGGQSSAIGGKPARRRIELSLQPSSVNSDLKFENVEVGMTVTGEIASFEDKGCLIDFGAGNAQGFLAFDSVTADGQASLKIGAVMAFSVTKKQPSLITVGLADDAEVAESVNNFTSLRPGTVVGNVEILENANGMVRCLINGTHSGVMDMFNLPVEKTLEHSIKADVGSGASASPFCKAFCKGTRLEKCRVVYHEDAVVGEGEKTIFLSALPSVLATDAVRCAVERHAESLLAVGRVLNGRVVRVDQGVGVIVELQDEQTSSFLGYAQVHISRLADTRQDKIGPQFKINSSHACRIIDHDYFAGVSLASMAASTLAQPFISVGEIEPGAMVSGEVVKLIPDAGIQVQLSDRVRAFCPIEHLTETQTPEALKTYRVGQKFKFRVLIADAAARKVVVTRKRPLLESELKPLTSLANVQVGEFYDGFVVAIRPFGCIVRFFNDIKAILPRSEMNEKKVENAGDFVFEGQVVTCRVIRVDSAGNNLAVSLLKEDWKRPTKAGSKSDQVAEQLLNKRVEKQAQQEQSRKKPKVVEASVEASVDAPVETPVETRAVAMQSPPASPPKAAGVKSVLPSLRQLEEEELAREEQLAEPSAARLGAGGAQAPDMSMREMCDEYEKKLLAAPNSSLLWIQYMSILVKGMEIDGARALGQRALQTVSMRLEGDKLNIWVALLNLELAYGTAESLKSTFERACVYNDSKKVHLALAQIYEDAARADVAGSVERVDEFYTQQLQKKFRQSCKVWLNYARFVFGVKKGAGAARRVLQQALEALPRRKHVKATLRFAQLEFRHGSADRARTLFEGVLATAPGRLDIWLQYADQEERHLPASVEALRRLYERMASLRLSSKKAKCVFKRFLDFEKQWGDQLGVQRVKDMALQYVEASLSK